MVGADIADQLRELAIALRKRSMTPVECALALRLVNMMSRLGVNDDSLEYFVSEIYTRSMDIGLDPKLISLYLAELVAFWSPGSTSSDERAGMGQQEINGNGDREENGEYRPFSEILSHVGKLKEEKNQLERENYRLRAEIMNLSTKKSEAEVQFKKRLTENQITQQHLNWYVELKSELQSCGLEVADVKGLVSAVRWVKENKVNLTQLT